MFVANDSAAFAVSLASRGRNARRYPCVLRSTVCSGGSIGRRATGHLGGLHAAGELVEPVGQVGRSDAVVGELGAGAHDGPLGAIERGDAVGGETNVEHHCRTRAVGQQARCALGQHGRVQAGLAVGQVQRHAPLPCLGVDRVAVAHEPGDIGDGVLQQQVVARVAVMVNAWSRSVLLAGSSVTNGTSVRSTCSVGSRRAASRQPPAPRRGTRTGTWNWWRICASPASSAWVVSRSDRIRTRRGCCAGRAPGRPPR